MFDNVRADVLRFVDQYSRSEGEAYRARVQASRASYCSCAARVLLSQYGLQALMAYRFGRWLRDVSSSRGGRMAGALLTPVHAAVTWCVRRAYDIDLDPSANIGPGLFISHVGDIRLHDCRLGRRCSIHHRVVIGPDPAGGGGPDVRDDVWIGPHAIIRGPLQVGEGATIGTGAHVSRDVPAGALVVGDPARIVPVRFDNATLLGG